ncbi:hypothetical protein CYMTET_4823 [Cymbomonas tetramitiformis]|uniref:Uncharacterized protein n=1 Tax=Cymbomonas tetramitiformis TaxID=36881 RepID=A0AAE0LJI2_9CHLO|nr:hypothetical protein CYMTET_4823 [Cymbomonas tetramitiformis]
MEEEEMEEEEMEEEIYEEEEEMEMEEEEMEEEEMEEEEMGGGDGDGGGGDGGGGDGEGGDIGDAVEDDDVGRERDKYGSKTYVYIITAHQLRRKNFQHPKHPEQLVSGLFPGLYFLGGPRRRLLLVLLLPQQAENQKNGNPQRLLPTAPGETSGIKIQITKENGTSSPHLESPPSLQTARGILCEAPLCRERSSGGQHTRAAWHSSGVNRGTCEKPLIGNNMDNQVTPHKHAIAEDMQDLVVLEEQGRKRGADERSPATNLIFKEGGRNVIPGIGDQTGNLIQVWNVQLEGHIVMWGPLDATEEETGDGIKATSCLLKDLFPGVPQPVIMEGAVAPTVVWTGTHARYINLAFAQPEIAVVFQATTYVQFPLPAIPIGVDRENSRAEVAAGSMVLDIGATKPLTGALQTTSTHKGSEEGINHRWVRRAHPELFVIVLKPETYAWLVTRGKHQIEVNFATEEDCAGGNRQLVAAVTLRISEYSRKGAKRGGWERRGRGAPPSVNLDQIVTKAAEEVVRAAREAATAEQQGITDAVATRLRGVEQSVKDLVTKCEKGLESTRLGTAETTGAVQRSNTLFINFATTWTQQAQQTARAEGAASIAVLEAELMLANAREKAVHIWKYGEIPAGQKATGQLEEGWATTVKQA